MATPQGNLDAIQQGQAIERARLGLHVNANQNGAIRPIVIGVPLPGAPAGVNGASLGCFRYMPRTAGNGLPISTPTMYGIGLDPLKCSPGVIVGVNFDASGGTKQGALILRPGDWYDVPGGFTAINVFAADGCDSLPLAFLPVARYPLGYVQLVGSVASGTRPTWAGGQKATWFTSNILSVGRGTQVFAFNAPARGYVQIQAYPLAAGLVPGIGSFNADLIVSTLPRLLAAGVVLGGDSLSLATLEDPFTVNPVGHGHVVAGFGLGAGACATTEIAVSAGLNLIASSTLRNLGAAAAAPVDVFLVVSWVGEMPGAIERVTTLYDTTSAANTALDTGALNLEDFEDVQVNIMGSAAMAGAPTLIFYSLNETDGSFTPQAACTVAAAAVDAGRGFGVGTNGGRNIGASADGQATPLPRIGKFTLGLGGAGITCRMIIHGRRRVI